MSFGKAKRFSTVIVDTPAPGQYDVSTPKKESGVIIPKAERFSYSRNSQSEPNVCCSKFNHRHSIGSTGPKTGISRCHRRHSTTNRKMPNGPDKDGNFTVSFETLKNSVNECEQNEKDMSEDSNYSSLDYSSLSNWFENDETTLTNSSFVEPLRNNKNQNLKKSTNSQLTQVVTELCVLRKEYEKLLKKQRIDEQKLMQKVEHLKKDLTNNNSQQEIKKLKQKVSFLEEQNTLLRNRYINDIEALQNNHDKTLNDIEMTVLQNLVKMQMNKPLNNEQLFNIRAIIEKIEHDMEQLQKMFDSEQKKLIQKAEENVRKLVESSLKAQNAIKEESITYVESWKELLRQLEPQEFENRARNNNNAEQLQQKIVDQECLIDVLKSQVEQFELHERLVSFDF